MRLVVNVDADSDSDSYTDTRIVPSITMQAWGGRADGAGSYSRDDRHKHETAIPVRVAICEAVVLKEMIEIGAPGGLEGQWKETRGAGGKQAREAGQRCKIRGVVEFVSWAVHEFGAHSSFSMVRVRSEPACNGLGCDTESKCYCLGSPSQVPTK